MEGRNTRVLWAGTDACAHSFPGGDYEVDAVGSARAALSAIELAESSGQAYAVCFLPWGEGVGAYELADLLRMSPELFLVVEGEEEALAGAPDLGAWADPARCLFVTRPLRPLVRKQLAEHFGARWKGEAEERGRRSLLENEAVRRRAHERRCDERLSVLYGLVEKLHGARSLEEALQVALGEMSRFLGARTGSLMLLEGRERLRVLEAVGPQRDRIRGLSIPLEESRISRYALEERVPILVEDIQESERFRDTEEGIRFRARSILSVPIFSQGEAVGVLNFGGDSRQSGFTEHDRDLVVTLGRQVAVALEKTRLLEGLQRTVVESIRALAGAIEAKDRYTRGHSDRVTHYVRLMGQAMGLSTTELSLLVRAAILHDVGKIGVPEVVLNKPSRLTDEELALIQRHPEVGVEIVREIAEMVETLPIIRAHHERFDGKGYPQGIRREHIPLGARIIAVADTFDAMTSDRPYRRGLPSAVAFEEIERCCGSQFDPEVARVFLSGAPYWPDLAQDDEFASERRRTSAPHSPSAISLSAMSPTPA